MKAETVDPFTDYKAFARHLVARGIVPEDKLHDAECACAAFQTMQISAGKERAKKAMLKAVDKC